MQKIKINITTDELVALETLTKIINNVIGSVDLLGFANDKVYSALMKIETAIAETIVNNVTISDTP